MAGVRRMSAAAAWKTKGIPGLLDVHIQHERKDAAPIVVLRLARAPTVDDIDEYQRWYLGMYDHWLAAKTQFSMLFDLRRVSLADLDMTVVGRKVLLTVALIPRTILQVSATSVLVNKPSTAGQRTAYTILKKLLFERKDTAPRFLTYSGKRAMAFVASDHVGGPLDVGSKALQKAVKTCAATLAAQADDSSEDDDEESSDFESSGDDDDDE